MSFGHVLDELEENQLRRGGVGSQNQSGSWVAGSWGPNLLGSHLNILELHAVQLSLQSSLVPVGSLVLVFSDNSTTFQALLKQGLSRSLSVTSVVSSIFYLCQEKELSISPHKSRGLSTSLQTPLCLGMFLSLESGRSVQQIDRLSMLSSHFGIGPDGYPLQLSSGSLRKSFHSPLCFRSGCLEPGLESMGGGVPVSSSVSSDQSFPSPALVKGRMVLFLRAHPQIFLSKDLPRMMVPLFPLLPPPRQLVR